jgi:hypothetical protein
MTVIRMDGRGRADEEGGQSRGQSAKLFYPFRSRRMPMRLVLFQRDDCPLCDAAIEVLAQARVPEFESEWIDGDASLEAHYGARVPVLRDTARDREIGWPFDAAAVRAFLL